MADDARRGTGPVALVFAGGDPPPRVVAEVLPAEGLVIAADSGLEHARALGRDVDLIVGDLDSVDADALAEAISAGTAVEAHPSGKDATDLELALEAARTRGAERVTVVGGHGGRLDHFVANALLLASPRFAALDIDGWVGTAHVAVVRGCAELRGRPGSLCTLLAIAGDALGVSTTGLRYALSDDVLHAGSTRGVSNELVAPVARVTVATGTLLAIQPHAVPPSPMED